MQFKKWFMILGTVGIIYILFSNYTLNKDLPRTPLPTAEKVENKEKEPMVVGLYEAEEQPFMTQMISKIVSPIVEKNLQKELPQYNIKAVLEKCGVKDKKPIKSAMPLKRFDEVIGTGAPIAPGQQVTFTYEAWNVNGMAITNLPVKAQFIYGDEKVPTVLNQGVEGMRVGGKRTLIAPSNIVNPHSPFWDSAPFLMNSISILSIEVFNNN